MCQAPAVDDVFNEIKHATTGALNLRELTGLEPELYEQVVATLLGPLEPDEAEMKEIGSELARRAEVELVELTPEGFSPAGYVDMAFGRSDHADCQAPSGETVNAFLSGMRCYRVVFQVGFVRI